MAAVRPPISATAAAWFDALRETGFQWPQCGPPSLRQSPSKPPEPHQPPVSMAAVRPPISATSPRPGTGSRCECFNGRSAAPHLCDATAAASSPAAGTRSARFNGRSAAPHLCDFPPGPHTSRPGKVSMAAVRPPISATHASQDRRRPCKASFNGRSAAPHLCDVASSSRSRPLSRRSFNGRSAAPHLCDLPEVTLSHLRTLFQWPQCGPPSLRHQSEWNKDLVKLEFQWPQCGPPSLRQGWVHPLPPEDEPVSMAAVRPPISATSRGGSAARSWSGRFNGRSAAPHLCDVAFHAGLRAPSRGFNGRSAAPHLCDSSAPALEPKQATGFNGRSAAPHLCDDRSRSGPSCPSRRVSMAAVRPPISAT